MSREIENDIPPDERGSVGDRHCVLAPGLLRFLVTLHEDECGGDAVEVTGVADLTTSWLCRGCGRVLAWDDDLQQQNERLKNLRRASAVAAETRRLVIREPLEVISLLGRVVAAFDVADHELMAYRQKIVRMVIETHGPMGARAGKEDTER